GDARPESKIGNRDQRGTTTTIGGAGRPLEIGCRQPRCLRAPLTLKTGGFASPPRGGFALFSICTAGAGRAAQRKIYKRARVEQTCPETETKKPNRDADLRR